MRWPCLFSFPVESQARKRAFLAETIADFTVLAAIAEQLEKASGIS